MEHKTEKRSGKKIKWNLILPAIHIVLSWIYQLFFWKIENIDPAIYSPLTPAYPSIVSFQAEQIFVYFISKLFGCILIFAIWQIAFLLFKRKKIWPFVLLLLGGIFVLCMYPYNWLIEVDNLMVYAQAVRYYPDYWQNMLTGCIYNACLLVFPHACVIAFVQTAFFLGAVYYLSVKFEAHFGKKAAFLPYICFLFPETAELMVNSYRNCIYAVFCIWFVSLLAFDLIENRVYTSFRLCLMGALIVILTILRTESVFFALIYVMILIWQRRGKIKEQAAYAGGAVVLALLLLIPQKLGEAKYFGNDYMIVNYINVISACLNDTGLNLRYDGAQEDLRNIAAIAPVRTIQYGGLMSYYNYNLTQKGTINQSMVTKEEQKAFLKASMRLFSHNLSAVTFNRVRYFAAANGIAGFNYEAQSDTVPEELILLLSERTNFGLAEVTDEKRSPFLYAWAVSPAHGSLYNAINSVRTGWTGMLQNLRLYFISRVLAICMLLLTVCNSLKKKEIKQAATGLVLLAMWCIIFAFCPEPREAYYYPIYYASLIWAAVFLGKDVVAASKEQSKTEETE